MKKDFDLWNTDKKRIHDMGSRKPYHEREVWWCWLGLNIGSEQDGSGISHERPVVIVRGFSADVCMIVPLTTSGKANRYHVSAGLFDGKESFAVISQLRLIDTRRLKNKLCSAPLERYAAIRKAVRDLF